MMFGHVETLEERIEHLLHLRELQDRTGGFTAFIAWTFQPSNTALAGEELTSFQYLRTLAVARVMLDNFPSVQASWVTQGSKIGQVSLRFGANDFGSLMIEENVVSAAGAHYRLTEAEIARDQEAGFVPSADHGLQDRQRPLLLEPRDAHPPRRARRATSLAS
jgi:cyclic dehypoxanthinyl futalosine synthase